MNDPYSGKYCKDYKHRKTATIDSYRGNAKGAETFQECQIPKVIFHPVTGRSESKIKCEAARGKDTTHPCGMYGNKWERINE